jgi:hypothetical protein
MGGPTILRGLTIGDDPAAWRGVGFAVEGDRCAVGGVTIRLVGAEAGRGVLAWSLDPAAPGPIDGLAHVPAGSQDRAAPQDVVAHPNGARLVDHVVVGTSDLERTTAALAELGLSPRRTVTGLRGERDTVFRFFLLGTCVLEVIAPSEPTQSSRPARFWGVAFVVDDLEATAAALGDRCGAPRDAVQPGRRIASLAHEAAGISVPVAFLTPR